MKKISLIRNRITSRLMGTMMALALVVGAALFTTAAVFAWGPTDRPTFTIDKPADYVTFNSMTNNPAHGDERNFVQIREAGTEKYVESVDATPGKEYDIYVYYHNNASTTYNSAEYNFKGIARDAKVQANVPSILKAGQRTAITATISASNAQPNKVWDEAYITSKDDVGVSYVAGSAVIKNRGASNNQKLPDTLFTSGAALGYDKLDGNLPGCNEFSGYVTFKIKVNQPNFTMKKQVSPSGKNQWSDTYAAKPGETVDYLVTYTNTGTTRQDNVVIKDRFPAGVSYINGSTQLANTANPGGAKASDNIATPNGINIGSYDPKGNAYLRYSVKIDAASKFKCGPNTLRNTATVSTPNGSKSDDADVTIDVVCQPDECKPGVPNGDERCNTVTPTVLPQTGPAELIGSIIAVAALAFGVTYFFMSRKAYKKAMVGGHTDGSEVKLLTARTTTKPEDDNTTKWSSHTPDKK